MLIRTDHEANMPRHYLSRIWVVELPADNSYGELVWYIREAQTGRRDTPTNLSEQQTPRAKLVLLRHVKSSCDIMVILAGAFVPNMNKLQVSEQASFCNT